MLRKRIACMVMAAVLVGTMVPSVSAAEPAETKKTDVLFDDFDGNQLDTGKWLIAQKKWGGNNGGVVKENVSVSNGTLKLEGHGLQYTGDVPGVKRPDGKLTGAAIATRDYYASGSYEVVAKVAPDLGACSAMWTFEYEEYYPGQPEYDPKYATYGYCTVNHEIDIEIPTGTNKYPDPNFSSARFNTYVRENDYTPHYHDLGYAQNDGKFHTYRFDWHTGDKTETPRVDFYVDNQWMYTSYTDIPTNEGRFWIGLWFPCSVDSDKDGVLDSGWSGKADFDTTVFEIDSVKITPYHEAGDTEQHETYAYDGWADGSFPEVAEPIPEETPAEIPFTDVKKGTWKYNVAKFVYERGIITGTSGTTFSPEASMTRGQFMVILWRMNGKPKVTFEKPFTDVTKSYFGATAVQWAKNNGLASGYQNGAFGPNDPMTRAQFAAFMYNYAKFLGLDTTTHGTTYTECPDAKMVSRTFAKPVQWAYERGFIAANGKLAPNTDISRIQAAAILMRFINYYGLGEETPVEPDPEKLFEVPYVSTYYFNPRPAVTDDIAIPLYITDYEQSEYTQNKKDGRLDLIYTVDEEEHVISNLPLGDYTLELGRLSYGMHTFTVQTLDKRTGMRSHKLFNELWVGDPAKDAITAQQTYVMQSSDLAKYKIHNDDSKNKEDLNTTRDGLSQMFADLQKAGYRKVVMLKGTYRINGEMTPKASYLDPDPIYYITIPSHFTVDMNGCTFKLDTVMSENNACLVRLNDAYDTHIENGILEGDRWERRALGWETEEASRNAMGEKINTLLFSGGKYCTATNMIIKNTTGHTVGSGNVIGNYTVIGHYNKTAIIHGEEVPNENCSTSDMIDLTKMMKWDKYDGYIFIGHLLGAKGIKGDSAILYASFYDENQNFMETITGMQYRKIKVPAGAKYLRVTLAGEIATTGYQDTISVMSQHLGDYYEFSDIDFYDTRTTAFAASCGNNVLMENCTYTRCGNSITSVAVDFEEGGEECQDYYYRNNKVLEIDKSTATVVDCAGYNHVYENLTDHHMEMRTRVMGLVVRNNTDQKFRMTWFIGDEKTSSYGRIYDNDCQYINFNEQRIGYKDAMTMKVKDCTIRNGANATLWHSGIMGKSIYENCTFPHFGGAKGVFVNCTIQPAEQMGRDLTFTDCTFQSLDPSKTSIYLDMPYDVDRSFTNCTFKGQTTMGTDTFYLGTFTGCDFEDVNIHVNVTADGRPTVFDNCTIRSSQKELLHIGPWVKSLNYVNTIFKNCDITHTGENLVYLYAKPNGASRVLFDNCTLHKTNGYIVSMWGGTENLGSEALEIVFDHTPVDKAVETNDKDVNPDRVKVVFK